MLWLILTVSCTAIFLRFSRGSPWIARLRVEERSDVEERRIPFYFSSQLLFISIAWLSRSFVTFLSSPFFVVLIPMATSRSGDFGGKILHCPQSFEQNIEEEVLLHKREGWAWNLVLPKVSSPWDTHFNPMGGKLSASSIIFTPALDGLWVKGLSTFGTIWASPIPNCHQIPRVLGFAWWCGAKRKALSFHFFSFFDNWCVALIN